MPLTVLTSSSFGSSLFSSARDNVSSGQPMPTAVTGEAEKSFSCCCYNFRTVLHLHTFKGQATF